MVDWHAQYGSEEVGTTDLYPLAVELFDLGHGSDRSQLTRLGILLGQARAGRYGGHRISGVGSCTARSAGGWWSSSN